MSGKIVKRKGITYLQEGCNVYAYRGARLIGSVSVGEKKLSLLELIEIAETSDRRAS